MLSKLTFISLLTEGINTVVPLFDDEINTCYEVIKDYLEENFSKLTCIFEENTESGFPTITISNIDTGENAFILSFENEKIFVLKDGDLLDFEVAGSMYGILTILCTFLIARLNGFSFKSREIDPYNTELDIDQDYDSDFDGNEAPDSDEVAVEEEESESSFDDEWL